MPVATKEVGKEFLYKKHYSANGNKESFFFLNERKTERAARIISAPPGFSDENQFIPSAHLWNFTASKKRPDARIRKSLSMSFS